ncbi:hypothetical protein ABZ743_09025 [Streptomyces sp. NPDC006662]|uniref:hypothetical protein n=1 Tax=Streptomyces sp. NPDC006662 TaxID=3156902 RepID=UPI0033D5793E
MSGWSRAWFQCTWSRSRCTSSADAARPACSLVSAAGDGVEVEASAENLRPVREAGGAEAEAEAAVARTARSVVPHGHPQSPSSPWPLAPDRQLRPLRPLS